jgi:hypothetical protein
VCFVDLYIGIRLHVIEDGSSLADVQQCLSVVRQLSQGQWTGLTIFRVKTYRKGHLKEEEIVSWGEPRKSWSMESRIQVSTRTTNIFVRFVDVMLGRKT